MIERGIQQVPHAAARGQKRNPTVPHLAWTKQIPAGEWAIYDRAISALRATGRPFMLAGAFSLATYTGRWRNTKDIDFYVLPEDREPLIQALTRAGFADYYETLPYVRHWIFRAHQGDCIVDIIWAMANQRAQVDEQWFERAAQVSVHGENLLVVPAEELLWCKLYVLQKDRCDWPDIFNLIHAVNDHMDWNHLVDRLGDDLPLLIGLLNVHCWLCPGADLKLPQQLRAVLPGCAQANGHVENQCHIDWLDTRPWFQRAEATRPGSPSDTESQRNSAAQKED
ncbi:MAG TPA: nucleotidyltransferase family protein [Methylomirabilota bacterium]|nr:nucleotidyltransferase family protein [Methylomirabilota bacterium]